MVMPPFAYMEAKRSARYHVQVQVEELDPQDVWGIPASLRPADLHFIRGRVVRLFRTEGGLERGSPVVVKLRIVVHAAPQTGDRLAVGNNVWTTPERLRALRYFEAFLNGEDPTDELEIPFESLWKPIAGPTDEPVMPVPTEEEIRAAREEFSGGR